MEFHLFHVFILLSVVFVASQAAQSSEDYWKSVLPNTPMPKAISELLQSPGHKGKPFYVGVKPGPNPLIFYRSYAATADQLHDNPSIALFFLEKDLHQGKSMNLHFTKSSTPSTFLPRNEADSVPFSSQKIPKILEEFSVNPNSYEAETIKNTINECEAPAVKGENKYCATSLESMVDYATSKFDWDPLVVSTEVSQETEMQKYNIVGSKKLGEKAVVCHKQNYAYAVFYCHKTSTDNAYTVSLVGSDGTKVKAAAVCHTDTSSWDPKHLVFQVLKVQPGSVPVCHFMPQGHLVWVQN